MQLAEYFDEVILILRDDEVVETKFPDNVNIHSISYGNYNTGKTLRRNFFSVISVYTRDFFLGGISSFNIRAMKFNFSSLLRSYYLAKEIEKIEEIKTADLIYTFWFDNWATVLAILKKQNKISDFCSLAHGYDVFEERQIKTQRIEYRWFQLKYIKKVISISQAGKKYLINRYKEYSAKIDCEYLQIHGFSESVIGNSQEYTIVSCANFNPVKRLELIPKLLEKFNSNIKWVHIGEVNENDKQAQSFFHNIEILKSANPNVSVYLLGKLSNKEVNEYYQSNAIAALISVSESEGLPVSMMEAISAGIPIISTNVGGCSEIVNEKTGILINEKIDFNETAYRIEKFLLTKATDKIFREGCKLFWEDNFSINKSKFLGKFNL